MCFMAAFAAASILTTAFGARASEKSAYAAGDANANIDENNARLADAQAKDAAILGARDIEQSDWKTRATLGKQQVTMAANGFTQQGTNADLLNDTALLGGADKSALAQDAARKAWGFKAQATNYRNQAALDVFEGEVKASEIKSSAISQIFSQGSNMLDNLPKSAGGGGGSGSGGGS